MQRQTREHSKADKRAHRGKRFIRIRVYKGVEQGSIIRASTGKQSRAHRVGVGHIQRNSILHNFKPVY